MSNAVVVKSRFVLSIFQMWVIIFLLMVLLFSSLFVSSVEGTSVDSVIHVENEQVLINAVSNALPRVAIVIVLDRDIQLTQSLLIVSGKNVTLTSNDDGNFKLIGPSGLDVITVKKEGFLTIDGISVTHAYGTGFGVNVDVGGTFILYDGQIFGNLGVGMDIGGGVYNSGTFNMYGGEIFNNTRCGVTNIDGVFNMSGGLIFNNTGGWGGGVYNWGDFIMSGGKISDNSGLGGGVCLHAADARFNMSGGEISGNFGTYGGVLISSGVFNMSGGKISNNKGILGGGVRVSDSFSMTGGEISGNIASEGGGVYDGGEFILQNGVISGNIAERDGGGGVYVGGSYGADGTFIMSGGKLLNNKAADGGGVYIARGFFNLTGGMISDNIASNNGGGIWIDIEKLGNLFVSNRVVFSNNLASSAVYNRDSAHDDIYNSHIDPRVIWSNAFTQGYNNYDISYTNETPLNTPEASNTSNSPKPTDDNKLGDSSYVVLVIVALGLIASIVIVMSIYFNRKGKQLTNKP